MSIILTPGKFQNIEEGNWFFHNGQPYEAVGPNAEKGLMIYVPAVKLVNYGYDNTIELEMNSVLVLLSDQYDREMFFFSQSEPV